MKKMNTCIEKNSKFLFANLLDRELEPLISKEGYERASSDLKKVNRIRNRLISVLKNYRRREGLELELFKTGHPSNTNAIRTICQGHNTAKNKYIISYVNFDKYTTKFISVIHILIHYLNFLKNRNQRIIYLFIVVLCI